MISVKETIDVKSLSIPEPARKSEQRFNPKKDISQEDWRSLEFKVGAFMGSIRRGDGFNWINADPDFLLRIGFLDPVILQRKVTDTDWDLLKKPISEAKIMDETKALITLKIINSEKFATEKKILKNFRKKYHFFQTPLRDIVGFNSAGYVRFIDEEGFNNLYVDLTDLDHRQKLISDWKKSKRWDHVGHIVANLKLIKPSLVQELPLYKDDWADLWDYLVGELKANSANAASGDHTKFLDAAYTIAILAAEDFRFEDNKFQLTYKEEEQVEQPRSNMPERRRF